jgi:hypothetical protein
MSAMFLVFALLCVIIFITESAVIIRTRDDDIRLDAKTGRAFSVVFFVTFLVFAWLFNGWVA